MTDRKPTPEEALADLKAELLKVFEPPLVATLQWLDRQLRRSPRLYAWLSR